VTPAEPPALVAGGTPQSGPQARELTVFDGDEVFSSGERCELGRNDHRTGPTVLYRDGQRRITYFSIYLPQSYPLNQERWQVVMQMKQTNPSDLMDPPSDDARNPVLALEAYDGQWIFRNSRTQIWSAPAQHDTWTRFAIDATYADDPAQGRVSVYVDLDNDGFVTDAYEAQEPTVGIKTLKTEIAGTRDDGLRAGDAIPSHLRMGLYHAEAEPGDPGIPCPRPTGCRIRIDNVQVVAAP